MKNFKQTTVALLIALGISSAVAVPFVLNNVLTSEQIKVGPGGLSVDGGIVVAAPNGIPVATITASLTLSTDGGSNFNQLMTVTGAAVSMPQVLVGAGGISTDGGISVTGSDISTTGTFSSTIASGSNAFAVSTNGARVDFGAGASDYASSDGTTVSFAGPVFVTSAGLVPITIPVNQYMAFDVGNTVTLRGTAGTLEAGESVVPAGNNTSDLGAVALLWRNLYLGTSVLLGGAVYVSVTAPSSPVACTSPTITHGTTASFQADVGSTCTGVSTFAFTVPATTNGTRCTGDNTTAAATRVLAQTAGWTGTTVTMTNFSRTLGTAADFADGADLVIVCVGR